MATATADATADALAFAFTDGAAFGSLPLGVLLGDSCRLAAAALTDAFTTARAFLSCMYLQSLPLVHFPWRNA